MARIESVRALMLNNGAYSFQVAVWSTAVEKGTTMERQWECKECGHTVHSYGRDTYCGNCDAQYNAFGQRLRDDWAGNPSNWDDEIGDMEGYEIQHANDW